jgi:hypothetical protein
MMFDRDRMIAQLLAMAAELGWKPQPAGDVIDLINEGALLTVQQAAIICGLTSQRILDWIEHAALLGQPFAEKKSTWLIGTDRLLTYIEKYRGGRPARVKAENLLQGYWPSWSQTPELRKEAKERAAS